MFRDFDDAVISIIGYAYDLNHSVAAKHRRALRELVNPGNFTTLGDLQTRHISAVVELADRHGWCSDADTYLEDVWGEDFYEGTTAIRFNDSWHTADGRSTFGQKKCFDLSHCDCDHECFQQCWRPSFFFGTLRSGHQLSICHPKGVQQTFLTADGVRHYTVCCVYCSQTGDVEAINKGGNYTIPHANDVAWMNTKCSGPDLF